jgi:hypothetical protein
LKKKQGKKKPGVTWLTQQVDRSNPAVNLYLSLDIALFLFNEISREMSKQVNYEILKEDNGLLKKANERL